jgi:2TM domain
MAESDDRRAAAIMRLRAKKDFWNHAVVYLVVNALVIVTWAFTGRGYFWPAWVLAGWGVGLAMHAWAVFFERPITEADIQREMERTR